MSVDSNAPRQQYAQRVALVMVPVLLVLVGLAASWWFGRSTSESRVVGAPMPPMTLQFVQGGALFGAGRGEPARVADVRGRLMIVNFWASWCDSCRQEAAEIESFWRAHQGEGIIVVGVAFNDEPANVRGAIREIGKTYPIALDPDNRAAMDYGITGVPETFFIRADGVVAHKEIGPVDRDLLESLRSSLLAPSNGAN